MQTEKPEKRVEIGAHPPVSGLAEVVERNIAALLEHRRKKNSRKSAASRISDRVTSFTGSLRFVLLQLVLVSGWIAVNMGWFRSIPRFDPSLVILAMFASVEAIFLSSFVLISQNRMAAMADERADLDLQVSLLAEHEVTRLITLVTAMARQMGIEEAKDPELNELKKDVAPEKVLERLEAEEEKLKADEEPE